MTSTIETEDVVAKLRRFAQTGRQRRANVVINGYHAESLDNAADTIERLREENARREAFEHDAREVAEALSIEAQIAAPTLREASLRGKMGDCARTLFKAMGRAALNQQ